jgi:3-oxoacyl-[acyl-carrier protein] reductase
MSTPGSSGAVLVTGGTGAVGSAVCRMLSAEGSDVAFSYRSNVTAADDVSRQVTAAGQRVLARAVDLSVADDAAAFVAEVAARFGGIRSIIYAGGPHVPQRYLSQVEPAEFAHHVSSEVVSFFNLVQPALEHLRESSGSIVAVTTVANRRFPIKDGLSSGPKAGIESIVRAIAVEEGRFGVRANAVGPGILSDGMAEDLHTSGDFDDVAKELTLRSIPLRRFGRAEDVAELVVFLASDRARYISGQSIDVDGGYSL